MYLCQRCGDMSIEAGVHCGEPMEPLEKALGFQDQLFELEGNDRAQNVLHHLKNDYEAAGQAVAKAEEKLLLAHSLKDATANTLLDFYKLSVESKTRR
jgi:hypothetical protein